jgi:hypothetical protein
VFDFRYHAISLAAVFLALAVGLLLGVAIGDEQLVSSARNQLENRLEEELDAQRAEVARLRTEQARSRLYEEQTLPVLVRERLAGRRVAIVFLNGRDDDIFRFVRDAVLAADGTLASVYTVRSPLDLEALGEAAEGTRFASLGMDPTLLDEFAARLGRQIVQPGRLLRQVRREVMSSTAGEVGAVESVVVVHGELPESDDDEAREQRELTERFERGLTGGLGALRTPVVGVEESTTEPSQIDWYRARGLASVDNVDQPPGRASMVYALSGSANGSYGIKSTRDAFLPDALTEGP